MHIFATSSASLDDLAEPVDLAQTPADIVALSFTHSDLAALGAAWKAEGDAMPSMRLAPLRDLRHPMSVDLWVDSVARHAKVILVRILGGYDWWRYGCDQLSTVARERGIKLVLLPGECRERDERLIAHSTLPEAEIEGLLAYFREGGPENMRALVRRLGGLAGRPVDAAAARPLPKVGFYRPGTGVVGIEAIRSAVGDRPVAPLLFYRSMLLAADVAPIDALCMALENRGIVAAPIFVSSLKDPSVVEFIENAARDLSPSVMITATAFSAGEDSHGGTLFDRIGVPVFQVITATTRRDAWEKNQRGLAPADLAMHVVMPELDGRILAGAISFKDETETDAALGYRGLANRPEPDRIEAVAERIAAMILLQRTPVAERRVAILLPHYPSAPGRTGYAVGLDVPQSVITMLHDLKISGYNIDNIPDTARKLLAQLETEGARLSLEDYRASAARLPASALEKVESAWGDPAEDCPPPLPSPRGERGEGDWEPRSALLSPSFTGRGSRQAGEGQRLSAPHEGRNFQFKAAQFGNITVALAPDRGRSESRRVDYHDPSLPPRHALIAFGLWLRDTLGCHAIVHVGAHGTLEWLPGKTVALTKDCFPEVVAGPLPVIYPFIVSNPGEAAQAKRRIGAATIGHLPPPLTDAGLTDAQRSLERLVDEYAQADGLDRRRRDRLAKLIVSTAAETGLAIEAGVKDGDDPDAALLRIDSWLCDLKDFAIKDGLHVFGRAESDAEPIRVASAEAERHALLAALGGKHIRPGPAGAPARGRTDVLPTGRNLFASDPRTMPTPTAFDLGKAGADEVLRRYLQDHGDWPRSLIIDLWGSASLRTGGEEIAQGLALMGCRPQWDFATGRVTGIEVLPPAQIGRPRVDVTWRISGLFRDMFPTQIALLDAAAGAVANRDEADGDNPLAATRRGAGAVPARIFGSAPGTYGAGSEALLASGQWESRVELGRAYLAATSHSYGGADGDGREDSGGFADRVATAELLIHTGDDPGRDILEGSADVAFIGGFAAAVAVLGGKADVIALDTTDPAKPRARSVVEAVTRAVRARATNPRFIAGQLRHGPRGASEFAETVDRLVGFAETTEAIPPVLIEAVYDAYLGDDAVRAFLLRENPAAARIIAERFASARRRGLWHPLRNSIDNDLAALIAEARAGTGRVNAPLTRRGECPTLAAPMQTGDGLLARLNTVEGGLSPAQLIGLADAAERHGNGIVEVTQRGSLQIRGLTAESAVLLSAEVEALGIAVRSGVPVETGPLAGLDPDEIADPRPLSVAIRAGIAASGLTERLGPKVSVVIDGGGHSMLGGVLADLRLTAVGEGRWQVALAGDVATAQVIGSVAESDAAAVALGLLGEIASHGKVGRARDLPLERLRSTLPPSVLPSLAKIGISPRVGEMSGKTEGGDVERLLDGRFAIVVSLPFGNIETHSLIEFVTAASASGATEVRLAPRRSLVLLCRSEASAIDVKAAAAKAGLITAPGDPRARIAACAGAPACASGHIPARDMAGRMAASLPHEGDLELHVSGCAKRCAKPSREGLTLLGLPDGVGLVVEDDGEQTVAFVAKERAEAAIGRVAALLSSERKQGETSAACLRRIGAARLATQFSEGA